MTIAVSDPCRPPGGVIWPMLGDTSVYAGYRPLLSLPFDTLPWWSV